MDNIHVVKETTLTVQKKALVLVIPYLGSISLQTRTKLKKLLQNNLNCCKLQITSQNVPFEVHIKKCFVSKKVMFRF